MTTLSSSVGSFRPSASESMELLTADRALVDESVAASHSASWLQPRLDSEFPPAPPREGPGRQVDHVALLATLLPRMQRLLVQVAFNILLTAAFTTASSLNRTRGGSQSLSRGLDHIGVLPLLCADLCCLSHLNKQVQAAFEGLWRARFFQPDLLGWWVLHRLFYGGGIEMVMERVRGWFDVLGMDWWLSN